MRSRATRGGRVELEVEWRKTVKAGRAASEWRRGGSGEGEGWLKVKRAQEQESIRVNGVWTSVSLEFTLVVMSELG